MAFASSGSARRIWTQSPVSAGGRSIVRTPLAAPYARRVTARESHGHSKDHFGVVMRVTPVCDDHVDRSGTSSPAPARASEQSRIQWMQRGRRGGGAAGGRGGGG